MSYCRVTLSWDQMAGATSYYVWYDQITPISTTSLTYNFTGLTPGTLYTFHVRSVASDNGLGDISTIKVTTPTVSAPIFKSVSMCSSPQVIQVTPISDATSYIWTVTNPLSINGAQTATTTSNSVNVQATALTGTSTITVYAQTSCGINSLTATGTVKLGKPIISSNVPLAYWDGSTYNSVCNLQNYSTSMNIINADNVTWTRIAANPINTAWSQSGDNITFYFFNVGQTAVFNINASNTCGANNNQFGFKSISCGSGCSVTYSAYPNPASQSVKVTPNIPAPCNTTLQTAAINGTVSVYDNQGVTKKVLSYKSYEDLTIDVSSLKNGLYYINIYDGKTSSSIPLIVKH